MKRVLQIVGSGMLCWSLCAGTAAAAADSGPADEGEKKDHHNLAKALKDGRYGIALRYRYEHATDDDFDKSADASTLRTALLYESGRFYRLFGLLEMVNVANLGFGSRHFDGTNDVDDRPGIPDPPGTEVYQAYLGYEGLKDTRLLAGRQEIILDDHRFVGNVAWRQNHQAYDGVRLKQNSIPHTTVDYSWVGNVNTVINTNRDGSFHLLQATVDVGGLGSVAGYFFRLDFDQPLEVFSSATYGARWAGTARWRKLTFPFRVELARQDDAADNPEKVAADYRRLTFGVRRKGLTAGVGYELLAGSPEDGQFNTPLATLHKFNGWADKFLITPDDGLEDLYLSVRYVWERWSGVLIWHRFDADTGGAHYGNELDGEVVYRAPWKQDFALAFARYEADDLFADTLRAWVYTTYRF